MGTVIAFVPRDASVSARRRPVAVDGAEVVILPVIRIDRYDDAPELLTPVVRSDAGRRRRRRASRS